MLTDLLDFCPQCVMNKKKKGKKKSRRKTDKLPCNITYPGNPTSAMLC